MSIGFVGTAFNKYMLRSHTLRYSSHYELMNLAVLQYGKQAQLSSHEALEHVKHISLQKNQQLSYLLNIHSRVRLHLSLDQAPSDIINTISSVVSCEAHLLFVSFVCSQLVENYVVIDLTAFRICFWTLEFLVFNPSTDNKTS